MGLVLAEFAIVLALDAAIFLSGGDAGLNLQPFSWGQITSGTPSIGILFCFAAFIGFEATTIYSEEAKDPSVTVPKATYLSVGLIGVFYILTSWLMVMGAGRLREPGVKDCTSSGASGKGAHHRHRSSVSQSAQCSTTCAGAGSVR